MVSPSFHPLFISQSQYTLIVTNHTLLTLCARIRKKHGETYIRANCAVASTLHFILSAILPSFSISVITLNPRWRSHPQGQKYTVTVIVASATSYFSSPAVTSPSSHPMSSTTSNYHVLTTSTKAVFSDGPSPHPISTTNARSVAPPSSTTAVSSSSPSEQRPGS